MADKRDLKCGPDSDFELNETLVRKITIIIKSEIFREHVSELK